jgi:hypothetical protein
MPRQLPCISLPAISASSLTLTPVQTAPRAMTHQTMSATNYNPGRMLTVTTDCIIVADIDAR